MKQGEEMQVNNLAKYLTSILNIDTKNPFIVDDMMEELEQISDLKAFKGYLKAKMNTEPYQYLNGYQKLLKAITEYKNINSHSKDEAIENYCRKLIQKIRTVARAIDESLPNGLRYNDFCESATFENFKSDGECAFTEKEQRLLNEVGACKIWLLTYDDNDFLLKLMRAIQRLNQKHLAPPQEKTLSLTDIKKGVR